MHRWVYAGAAATSVAASACGASTNLTAVWKEPTTSPIRFERVIVAFQAKDQALRRSIEDHMAARIANATPSYKVRDDAEATNLEQAKAKVTAAGFDGAVAARFVGVETDSHAAPASGPRPAGQLSVFDSTRVVHVPATSARICISLTRSRGDRSELPARSN